VIHPVAATTEKTWPAERFLAVARRVAHEYEPLFIGGPGDDLSAFSEFKTIAGAPLQKTKALLAGASLFLGNDSGPAHMAAAFGVPVVVLFGPSDPVVWAPWQVEARVFAGAAGDITAIPADQVAEALSEMRVKQ
jgi:ADP-heptose:LPS heptosyltransferase